MANHTKAVLAVIAVCVSYLPIMVFAGGDLGDQAWNRIHEVPTGSTWQISWVSPYDQHEIRGSYDLKIIGSKQSFDVLSQKNTDVRYDEINCDVCITALSKTKSTVLLLSERTQFGVFNDMIDFKLQEQ